MISSNQPYVLGWRAREHSLFRSEANSTMRALDPALVSVIIKLLNDSERLLNKKWLRPVISKSNASIGWKAKGNTFLPEV